MMSNSVFLTGCTERRESFTESSLQCGDLDIVRVGLDRWEMETALVSFVAERRLRKV